MMKSKLILLSIILLNTCFLIAQANPNTLIHKVTEKENLYRIALKYGTSIQHIEAMNPALKSQKIKIGMKLTVPVPAGGVSAILPGPALAPKPEAESAIKTQDKKAVVSIATNVEQTTKKSMGKEVSYFNSSATPTNDSDSFPSKRSGKVIRKNLTSAAEKSDNFSLDITFASSAEERKNELLQLAKRDRSIVVVTTLHESNSFMAQVYPVPTKLSAAFEQQPTTVTRYIPTPERKAVSSDKDMTNPPSAASLRKVLLAAERGEDMIVNLQIIMKDGAVICVTDPSVQLQMVSELLQAQR